MNDENLACPYITCDKKLPMDIIEWRFSSSNESFFKAYCRSCSATGPAMQTKELAAQKWREFTSNYNWNKGD